MQHALEDGIPRRGDRSELAPRAPQRLVSLGRHPVVNLVIVVQLANKRQVLRISRAARSTDPRMDAARRLRWVWIHVIAAPDNADPFLSIMRFILMVRCRLWAARRSTCRKGEVKDTTAKGAVASVGNSGADL